MNVESTLILHSISLSRARPFSLYVHLVQELEWYLDMGFYISVSGVVCKEDRGAPLREILPLVPDNRLMVETDAPYLGTSGRERMTYICSVFKQHSHLAVVARPAPNDALFQLLTRHLLTFMHRILHVYSRRIQFMCLFSYRISHPARVRILISAYLLIDLVCVPHLDMKPPRHLTQHPLATPRSYNAHSPPTTLSK